MYQNQKEHRNKTAPLQAEVSAWVSGLVNVLFYALSVNSVFLFVLMQQIVSCNVFKKLPLDEAPDTRDF